MGLFAPETDLDAYAASLARLAGLVPDLTRLLPAHNTPVADPIRLIELRDAFSAVRDGTLEGTRCRDGRVRSGGFLDSDGSGRRPRRLSRAALTPRRATVLSAILRFKPRSDLVEPVHPLDDLSLGAAFVDSRAGSLPHALRATPFNLVQNWFEELKARVPVP